MRIEQRGLEAAVGHILCHNLADAGGRRAFIKGRTVRADDLAALAALGHQTLRVAVLEEHDVHEDAAAAAVAAALAGSGVSCGNPQVGRVNLSATQAGTLYIDAGRLSAVNLIDGVTAATLAPYLAVERGRVLATIKIIPFAVAQQALDAVRRIGAGGVLTVQPHRLRRCGVVLVAAARAQARVERAVWPALEARLTALDAGLVGRAAVEADEAQLAAQLDGLRQAGAELLIVAGETSVVDSDDVLPRALRRLGGRVAIYGAPVEPGNLLMLGYLGTVPVIGAPGCVRSRDTNVVDLLLPRLMSGELVEQAQVAALGVGGLLSRQ